MTEQIELHAEIDAGGQLRIKDQHGRELRGVQSAQLNRAMDEAASMRVEVLEYRGGYPFVRYEKPA